MSFTHSIERRWTDGSTTDAATASQTADGRDDRDIAVPASTTDMAVAFALDVSQAKSLFITSDQDITIKTNSSSAPDDTLTLKANQAVAWQYGDVPDGPFGTDVTVLYITNAGASSATLKVRCLVDTTV